MDDYQNDYFMNDTEIDRTKCSMCKEPVHSDPAQYNLVYSQGKLVCPPCKEIAAPSDRAAFDRDMGLR